MSVSTLLDDGAWTLDQSRRALGRAAAFRERTRELILTYRSHRVRVIAGSSDLNDPVQRAIARALASQPTKSFAGLSRGGICMLCDKTIKEGEPEYEVEAASLKIILDGDCYNRFREQVAEGPSADGGLRS